MSKRDHEAESGAAMAAEKRAEIAKNNRNRRKWLKLGISIIVVLCAGVMIWRYGWDRGEIDATLEALIEESKKDRAALEELTAKVEELRERMARDRLSP